MKHTRSEATIRDVAARAGVSKSTVSRALSGIGAVDPATRAKVKEAARELGYVVNTLARGMTTGASTTLGVVVPDLSAYYFSQMVRGLSRVCVEKGFDFLVIDTFSSLEDEKRAFRVLLEKRVDGIVLAPIFPLDDADVRRLREMGVLLCFVDRASTHLHEGEGFISSDHVGASRKVVDHLVRLGHTRIGIVTVADVSSLELSGNVESYAGFKASELRLRGYVDGLAEHGIEFDPELVGTSRYDRHEAYAAMRALLTRAPDVTAAIATDNVLSAGVFAAIQDSGLSCPGEISFVGWDNHEWTSLVRPTLTVVEQDPVEIGRAAAEMLIAELREGTPGEERRMPPRLIRRDSVAPPRSR